MLTFDTVIHQGTLITPAGTYQADLGISGEVISAIGHEFVGDKIIDATGLYVLPGAIDPHVHLETPVGSTQTSDSWYSGTIAAACGGTTTVLDFVEPAPGQLLLQAFDERIAQAHGHAVVDYGLHMTLVDDQPKTLSQIPDVLHAGCTSFKTYLTYEGFRLSDEALLTILDTVNGSGGLVMVHAENDAIITYLTARLLDAGRTSPRYQPSARPELAEAEAVHRALLLAEVVGAPLYVVHISTAAGARELDAARQRGVNAYGETCPQYLLLTQQALAGPGIEGAKFICAPPLRTAVDNAALWQALAQGSLQTVGTDHCPFFYHGQKDLGGDNFSKIPGGLPGIESRLALLHTFGVRRGLLSLERWVELCCTAPAQVFGLYPRKGSLEPGSDADIVLFDPRIKRTISLGNLHEHVDYTPYEGFELEGVPTSVFLRGDILVHDENYFGLPPTGKYLACRGRA